METKKFTPSAYQQAIFDFVLTGKGNAVIDAVAGSGKTTTIIEALKMIPAGQSIIFVAFNKSIVNELTLKVPAGVEVRTMHSFGFGVIRKNYGNVTMREDKVREIAKMLFPSWNVEEGLQDGYINKVCKLVELAKMNLCMRGEELYTVAEHHNVELYNSEVENAWTVYNYSNANKKIIDMADMIFMPAFYGLASPTYDWVLVDECQDLNKAQQAILRKMVKPGTGRFIAVGDPRQAIYGFAGADANSFRELAATPNTISLPLSVNYRCGKNIIELAQSIVPQITAFEGSVDGNIDYDGKWKNIEDGDFVLCRNMKPLVKLCFELIADGKKANVRGKEIGKNLVNMLTRTKKKDFDAAISSLYKDVEKQVSKMIRRGKTEQEARESSTIKGAIDKVEAIEMIGGSLRSVDRVIEKIEALFTDDKQGIILSTIHKAKGLESNNVFILNSELMPSKWARQDWEREQENNLMYVAYTRAKHNLVFIADYDGTK